MAKYFTSDWHLNEKRIGDFNPFFRPFKTVEEQNQTIIRSLNDIVQPSDELYLLGDVAMDEDGVRLLEQVRCKNRYLVIGNYDQDKLGLLSGYFKDMKYSMDVTVGSIPCYLNHYPVNYVNDRFNIVGHIHGLWKVKPNMVNVGVDAWHFRPVSEAQILQVHDALIHHYDENVFVHCNVKQDVAKVIIPKTYVDEIDAPLIFLAGPIRSAPNWQDEAIRILFSYDQNLVIASPRRDMRDTIAPYIATGIEDHFHRQRAWERHYLDIASKTGCILFWLPGEEVHDCNKVYGAMTRVELGEWMTNYRHDNSVRFCVGSDGRFQELDTIRYDMSIDAHGKDVKTTLEDTCIEALRLAKK